VRCCIHGETSGGWVWASAGASWETALQGREGMDGGPGSSGWPPPIVVVVVGPSTFANFTPPPMVLRLLLPSFVFPQRPQLVKVFHLGHRAPFYPPSVRHAGEGSRWICCRRRWALSNLFNAPVFVCQNFSTGRPCHVNFTLVFFSFFFQISYLSLTAHHHHHYQTLTFLPSSPPRHLSGSCIASAAVVATPFLLRNRASEGRHRPGHRLPKYNFTISVIYFYFPTIGTMSWTVVSSRYSPPAMTSPRLKRMAELRSICHVAP
jgi:hypothetical protein